MINYLALLVALSISAVSAYYSIIGLATIFAAAYYPVIVMGGVLELGKLVTASWLYRNWRTCPFLLKSYLSFAVFMLMFISSMGVFGFLSKAHIEQQLTINTGAADKAQVLQNQIDSAKEAIADLDKQIVLIDNALAKMTDRGQAASSLQAADKQRKTRDGLVKRKNDYVRDISTYTTEKIAIDSGIKKLEAEVGPIKYIAELVYSTQGRDDLEKAVRMVILLLVSVFDPLAVILLLAANHGLNERNNLTKLNTPSILRIDDNVLGEDNVTAR